MSIFKFADGSTLSDEKIDEIQTMVLVREPDRLDELPAQYKVITGEMLGYNNSTQKGSVDAQGYFHADYPARDGQAIAILQDDGTIAISFRGTNSNTDLFAINTFGNNQYIYGFDEWLSAVAKFAQDNGHEIDIVTGKSLGGACVNMLRDEADKIADGAFADAAYFAVASPLIADSDKNIINYGYTNDYAHEWYEEKIASGGHNETSVMDNLVYYNSKYASSSWSPFLEMSSHSYNSFSRGVDALQRSVYQDDLQLDDFIILGETANIDMNLAAKRVSGNFDKKYFIGVNNSNFNIEGTSGQDIIETRWGDDTVRSGDGEDIIHTLGNDDLVYAGNGDDKIYGGSGEDKIYGENGNDIIMSGWGSDIVYAGNGNDEIQGLAGNDRLYGNRNDDTIYGGSGNDRLNGGLNNDTLYGGEDNDRLYGHKGTDILFGDAGNDRLYGNHQNDILYGGDGDDYLDGGKNDDVLYGGAGNDLMQGYSGADIFVFEAQGQDRIKDFKLGKDHLRIADHLSISADELALNSNTISEKYLEIKFDDENSLTINNLTIEQAQAYADENGFDSWQDTLFA